MAVAHGSTSVLLSASKGDKRVHFAVQLSRSVWLVTVVSEVGITETRRMTSVEFVATIEGEARLGVDGAEREL